MDRESNILTILNINLDEKKRVILLILHSFFMGVYISYFFSFANGIFLSKFEIKYLPLAYVLSGLLGYVFSAIFVVIQNKIKFYDLLVGTLLFILLITSFFVVGFKTLDKPDWLIFIVFISIGPIFSLINVSFWSLATSLFDLRAGKRLFGVIGSGSVISSILGYFSIPLVLLILGNETSTLMVIANIGLVIGIVFQLIIMKQLPEAKAVQQVAKKKSKEPGLSLKEIFTNKYFRYIFLVVVFSMVVEYFVDYNFMDLARSNMKDEVALTSFFGIYYGLVKIVELLFRTLVSGRLMSKYGMILGLLLLPILLLSFILIALGGNLFTSGLGFLFLLFALIKLIDKVIRRSFEEPAVKTLYQPVDSKTKLLLQTSIEGKGKQLAVMLAGVLLMLFNLIPSFSVPMVAVITCFLIVVWIINAYKTYNEYRVILNKQLALPSDKKIESHLAKKGIYFSRGVSSENQVTFERSVAAIHEMKPDALIPLFPVLINHPDENVRVYSTKWIKKLPLLSLAKNLNEQLEIEEFPENIDLLKETIAKIKSIADLTEDQMNDHLRSENIEERIKAAAWICHYQKQESAGLLDTLLKDKKSDVVQATCFYISSVQNHTFLKSMLDHLIENKSYEHAVLRSIMINDSKSEEVLNISFNEFNGDDKFVLLEDAFRESQNQPLTLIGMIHKLGQLENTDSIEYLKSKLNIGNWGVQYFILQNLKQLGYTSSELELSTFRQIILKETAFCAWILASMNDIKKGVHFPDLMTSLDEQLAGSKNKIFNVLSFLYPREAIANIENNLMSGVQENEVLALEMADILLDEIHKDIIFPLIDKISVAEKVKNLRQHFPQKMMKKEDRLKNIIFYDYAMLNNVTKALGVKALCSISETTPYETIAQIYGHDILLKEIAYGSIYNQDESLFNKYVRRESEKAQIYLTKLCTANKGNQNLLSRLNIVQLLKDLPLFEKLPFWKLSMLDHFFNPLFLKPNERLNINDADKGNIHILINGSIQYMEDDGGEIMLKNGDIIGFYDGNIFEREITVIEDSLLFSISKSNFYSILEGLPEVCEGVYKLFMAEDISTEEEVEINEELFLDYVQ